MSTMPKNERRWDVVLLWIEPAVAAILGLVLYFPLQRKDLAEITWVLGIMLSVGSIVTIKRLREEFSITRKLSEVVDLSQKCNVHGVSEVLRLYMTIKEMEFQSLRDDIIDDCISTLTGLAYDKVIEVGSGEYHLWLLEMLRITSQKERIIAISVVPEFNWTEIPAEKKYLDENIKAARRGVKIERIFVSSKDRLQEPRNRGVILKHIERFNDGLTAHIVWQEDLEGQDPTLMDEIGAGFIQFGDRVVLIDTSLPPEEARGRITMNPAQLKRCARVFERLKLHARKADKGLFSQLDNERE